MTSFVITNAEGQFLSTTEGDYLFAEEDPIRLKSRSAACNLALALTSERGPEVGRLKVSALNVEVDPRPDERTDTEKLLGQFIDERDAWEQYAVELRDELRNLMNRADFLAHEIYAGKFPVDSSVSLSQDECVAHPINPKDGA